MLVDKGFGAAQTINNYLNGKTEPKADFLEKFIKEFRVSAKWLMIGQGSKHENIHSVDEKSSSPEIQELKEAIEELRQKFLYLQDKYTRCLEELLKKGSSTKNRR